MVKGSYRPVSLSSARLTFSPNLILLHLIFTCLKCLLPARRIDTRATLGSWPTILEHLRGRTCIFGQRPLEPGTTLQIAAETILIGKFGQLRKTMLSCSARDVILPSSLMACGTSGRPQNRSSPLPHFLNRAAVHGKASSALDLDTNCWRLLWLKNRSMKN